MRVVTKPPTHKRAWSRQEWLRKQPHPVRLFGLLWLGAFAVLALLYNPTGYSLVGGWQALTSPWLKLSSGLLLIFVLWVLWRVMAKHLASGAVLILGLVVSVSLLMLERQWQFIDKMNATVAQWLLLGMLSFLLGVATFSMVCNTTRR